MRPMEIARFLEEPTVAKLMAEKNGTWCAVDDMDLIRQAEGLRKGCGGCASVGRLLMALAGGNLHHGFVRTDQEVGLDEAGAAQIQQALNTPSAAAAGVASSEGEA